MEPELSTKITILVYLGLSKKVENTHIDVSYHGCWEALSNGEVNSEYCPSTKSKADTLTKPMGPYSHKGAEDLISLMASFHKTM